MSYFSWDQPIFIFVHTFGRCKIPFFFIERIFGIYEFYHTYLCFFKSHPLQKWNPSKYSKGTYSSTCISPLPVHIYLPSNFGVVETSSRPSLVSTLFPLNRSYFDLDLHIMPLYSSASSFMCFRTFSNKFFRLSSPRVLDNTDKFLVSKYYPCLQCNSGGETGKYSIQRSVPNIKFLFVTSVFPCNQWRRSVLNSPVIN